MSSPAPSVKVCRCCSRVFTREAWELLEAPVGGLYMTDGETVLELRNCACGTTLALPVDLPPEAVSNPA